MPQHDMNIANADGATARSDINNALLALVSNNSGATEPATKFAYMWWPDTTSGYLKQRNAANTAWLNKFKLSEGELALLNGSAANDFAAQTLTLSKGLNEAKTTVASAASPDIWTSTGNVIDYTGTATATGFAAAPQAGARRTLVCAGAAPFTAGANVLIDGYLSGATFTAAANDKVDVIAFPTATQFLLVPRKYNGTAVASSSVSIGSFTRDVSLAAGTQVVAHGLGRTPGFITFYAGESSTAEFPSCIGWDSGTQRFCQYRHSSGGITRNPSVSILLSFASADNTGYITAIDATNFTITWTKAGAPTGTYTIDFVAA